MSGALPPNDFGNISPMQQDFRDPFPADVRRSRQMDRDDLPLRMSSMDLGGEYYEEREPVRRQSFSRPIFGRSTSTSIPQPIDYELWRFEKDGAEWTSAIRKQRSGSQKDLAKKAKSRSKNGAAVNQIQKMGPNRLQQVEQLVQERNLETGLRWEPAWMEEVKASISRNNKKDVRIFDVIIGRAGITGGRSSLSRPRTNSTSLRDGERVVIRGRTNSSKDRYDDDRNYRDAAFGKYGSGRIREVVDPDPFGNSKLFAPSGKPLEPDGNVAVDKVALPPHIREEEPIGRKIPKKKSFGQGANGRDSDDQDEIIQIHDNKKGHKGGDEPEMINDNMFDGILPLPKSKGKKKKQQQVSRSRSRSKSKPTSRARSRSKSRGQSHSEHRRKGPERVGRYMDDRGSVSSNGSGDTHFMMDDDDNTSFTSSSIHRDMEERGSLHRKKSSKHRDLPFREHYRGPQQERRGSREYFGEQIIIPHREPRRVLPTYQPKMKTIGYGDPWLSGGQRSPPLDYAPRSPDYLQRGSPDYPRSLSPRRPYGAPELLYPHEMREADERSEHYVDSYMRGNRLDDLRERDYMRDRELDERERAVARKERALRRVSQGYGHVRDGRYR
jgi:hypothetical protein